MVTVTISEKGGQQSQYEFQKSEITIGRMKGNDIVLPKGNVSKKHSRISIREGTIQIVDLNSTNGTYVNGRKVAKEQTITSADKVYVGDFIIQVEEPAPRPMPAAPPSPPQPSRNTPAPNPQRRATGASPPAPPRPGSRPRQPAHSGSLQMPSGASDAVDDLFAAGDSSPSLSSRQTQRSPSPAPKSFDELLSGPDTGRQQARASTVRTRAPSAQESALPEQTNQQAPRPTPNPTPTPAASASQPVDVAPQPKLSRPHAPPASRRDKSSSFSSMFDADFHAAQTAAADILLQTLDLDDLPIEYPPLPEDRQQYEREVRSAIASVDPKADRNALTDILVSECIGLGPIDLYLQDPSVQDIYINRHDQILIRRDGDVSVAEHAFSDPEFLYAAAQRLLGTRTPIGADEVRFGDGTRVHVVMPPLAVFGPALTIRKPPTQHPSLDDLVSSAALSPGMREFLEHAVDAGQSILVAGPTSSGKSTLVGALARSIANGTRIIAIEESSQLKLPQDTVVRLEADPAAGHDLNYLVNLSMAMHPQRIILDECHGREAYGWVSAAAGGTEGSIITTQGTNSADALGRLESLAILGGPDTSPRGLREQISRAIDLVVVVSRRPENQFSIQQITELQGVDLDAFRLNDVFYQRIEGTEKHFHPTGYIPLFYEDLRLAGGEVDFDIFRE